ncbi:hypothetical protein [Halosimplex marinum]|uniref:hypothetical protein n=1 Tax=Halosimplex marinum TaxID=3396620 RepID=UPI003F57761A
MAKNVLHSIILRVIEVAPGLLILLGLLYYFTPDNQTIALLQILLSLIIALIGVVVGESLQLRTQFTKNKSSQDKIIELISDEGLDNPMARLFLKVNAAGFEPRDFPSVFLEVLWSIEDSYRTTMVASSEQIEQGHNQQGLEIQGAKIADGAEIKRIFVCENEEMVQELFDSMKEQQDIGIQVRYILTDQIYRNQFLKEGVKNIGQLDFSIIDDTYTLKTEVNTEPENYRIEGCSLSYDDQKVTEYGEVFSNMWSEANKISNIDRNN